MNIYFIYTCTLSSCIKNFIGNSVLSKQIRQKKTNSYLYIADMLEYKSDLGGYICSLESLSDW